MRRGDFQLREEIAEQIRALKGMKEMAAIYGYDISQPAKNAKEAVPVSYTHLVVPPVRLIRISHVTSVL